MLVAAASMGVESTSSQSWLIPVVAPTTVYVMTPAGSSPAPPVINAGAAWRASSLPRASALRKRGRSIISHRPQGVAPASEERSPFSAHDLLPWWQAIAGQRLSDGKASL